MVDSVKWPRVLRHLTDAQLARLIELQLAPLRERIAELERRPAQVVREISAAPPMPPPSSRQSPWWRRALHVFGFFVLMLAVLPARSQAVFNFYGPAAGVQKNSGASGFNTAAAASDIIGLWSGTCSSTNYLGGAGACPANFSWNDTSYVLTLGVYSSNATLQAQNGAATATGGTFIIQGGAGGSSGTHPGGELQLLGGYGGSGNGAGGDLFIEGGQAEGTGNASPGGTLFLQGGVGSGSGTATVTGGAINITGGTGGGFSTGNATAADGGEVTIAGGVGGTTTGAAGTHANGGNLLLEPGAPGTAATTTAGNVEITDDGVVARITVSGANGATTLAAPGGDLTISNITTGTDTYAVCATSGFALVIDSSNCISSTERTKEHIAALANGDAVLELNPVTFNKKAPATPPRDPNYARPQAGLIAEDVARALPLCAVYEDDLKTPKSYRPECVLAYVVARERTVDRELAGLWVAIAALVAWCAWLTALAVRRA